MSKNENLLAVLRKSQLKKIQRLAPKLLKVQKKKKKKKTLTVFTRVIQQTIVRNCSQRPLIPGKFLRKEFVTQEVKGKEEHLSLHPIFGIRLSTSIHITYQVSHLFLFQRSACTSPISHIDFQKSTYPILRAAQVKGKKP